MMPSMLQANVQWVREAVQESGLRVNKRYVQFRYGNLGEPFIDEDWDVLIILDACRPEFLYECELPAGDRSVRYSVGSESWEFMRANFEGRALHDTVYVTANPHAFKLSSGIFYHVRNLLEDAWDEKAGTVLPGDLTEAVREATQRFPDKRLIAHYMQPHFPFIGETGATVDESAIPTTSPGSNRPGGPAPWSRLEQGDDGISRSDVVDAYRENHEIVASELFDVLEAVKGKIVVTADHANLIGDRGWPIPIRMYGHLSDFPHPNLRRVPWLEIERGTRPEIVSEEPVEAGAQDTTAEVVHRRLQELGYA